MGSEPKQKLTFWALTALVIGSMLDSGIFSLPATFGRATGVVGVFLVWGISGTGMLMLALVFQDLANRKWNLDAGIFSYAKDGFGDFMGFISVLGFWAGGCVGMVSYFIMIKSSLGKFFPVFGTGDNIPAVLSASALLWLGHFIVLRGVREAALLHILATALKVGLLFFFLFFVLRNFDMDIFLGNTWLLQNILKEGVDLTNINDYGRLGHASAVMEAYGGGSVFFQVRHLMLVTVYVFVGIEGASIYSRYAKKRIEVGKATVTGFLVILLLYFLATTLPFGVLPHAEIVALRQPSLVSLLRNILGDTGMLIANIGMIVAVVGAYLAWVLLSAEVLFMAAKSRAMPSVFGTENLRGVPAAAMWLTTGTVQMFLFVALFADYAYGFMLELTGAMNLVPFFLVALYAVKLTLETNALYTSQKSRKKQRIISSVALMYMLMMLIMGGPKYLVLPAMVYLPGCFLFFWARLEQRKKVFVGKEQYMFIGLVSLSLLGIYLLSTGVVSLEAG